MKLSITVAFVLATALIVVGTSGGPRDAEAATGLYNAAGCSTNTLPANDDLSTGLVDLGFTINFFGNVYSQVYVNNNGNVTFDSSQSTYTPFDLNSTSRVIMAPFFADVDTTGTGSGLVTYGQTTFGGSPAFCVTWDDVGYFGANVDKLNSFQLVIIDRSSRGVGDFDMLFAYESIEWETGDVSGGTGGLGGSSARVGYSNGAGQSYELPGSAVPGTFLDNGTSPLVNGSLFSGFKSGWYFFRVEGGEPPTGNGKIFGSVNGGGQPMEGSYVQACFAGDPGSPCQTTLTNSAGQYAFNGLATGGNYFVTAFPPGTSLLGPRTIGALFLDAGQTLSGQKIELIPSVPPPPGITVQTPYTAHDGTPAVSSTTGAPVVQTGACTGGSGTWSLKQNGGVLASGVLVESPPGTYTAMIPPLPGTNGRATMNWDVDCPGGTPDKDVSFDIYIDPSGNVYESNSGDPLEGATVTLMRSDSEAGPFEVVPDGSGIMSPSNRTNPDLTDAEGFFRWDVLAGFYQLRIEKAGCVNPDNAAQAFVLSDVYQVPPPAVDLEFFLDCGGAQATPTHTPPGPPPTPTPTSPDGEVLFGDANCDGSVNSIDATLILQLVAGLLNSLNCEDAADVNGSGDLNSIDATIVLQFVAGLLNALPV